MKIERTGSVALLRMEGGKANAMGPDFLKGLTGLLDRLDAGDTIVLTGYDRFFSAGLQLPVLIEYDRPAMKDFLLAFEETFRRVYTWPRPVVAAINGHAVAGGCALAMMADHRIMTDGEAKIGMTEAQLGVGLPPVLIEPFRRQLPASSITPVLLEGRLFTPDEAHGLGLVSELSKDVLPASLKKAEQLAAVPAAAFAQIKGSFGTAGPDPEGSERWLDTWFSEDARRLLAAAVEGLKKKK